MITQDGNVTAKGDPKTIDFANLSFAVVTNENSDSTNAVTFAPPTSSSETSKLPPVTTSATERPTFTLDEDF